MAWAESSDPVNHCRRDIRTLSIRWPASERVSSNSRAALADRMAQSTLANSSRPARSESQPVPPCSGARIRVGRTQLISVVGKRWCNDSALGDDKYGLIAHVVDCTTEADHRRRQLPSLTKEKHHVSRSMDHGSGTA